MRKNNMRTVEEKVSIVKEMIENNISISEMSRTYNISTSVLSKWLYSYKDKGIEGLKSKTGKKLVEIKVYGIKKQKTKLKNWNLK